MKIFLKKLASLVVILLILAVSISVFAERQNILDWIALYHYQPSQSVQELADATTMDAYARKLFYVNHPDIESKVDFGKNCNGNEKTIVLGCYISGRGIFLYNVQDSRLSGVHEVTAAHEMLHVAYERLSATDRANVNRMVSAAFANLHDDRLNKTIEQYRQKDPSVVNNELHSILGTEVRNLPPNLENYYKRYFTDRAKIVSLSEQYEKNFTDREAKINAFDTQLAALKKLIDAGQSNLRSKLLVLQNMRSVMDGELKRKDYQAYNADVPIYNAKVNDYNNLLAAIKTNIDSYNQIVVARNAIADEEQQLIQAIDSRLPQAQ